MKNIFLAFTMVLFSQASFANAEAVNVQQLFCKGTQHPYGSMTVTYTGFGTFNLTHVNVFGFPFSEQALIAGTSADQSKFSIELKGLVTGRNLTLTLAKSNLAGEIEADVYTMPMTCSGQVDVK